MSEVTEDFLDDACVYDSKKLCECWVRLSNGENCPHPDGVRARLKTDLARALEFQTEKGVAVIAAKKRLAEFERGMNE